MLSNNGVALCVGQRVRSLSDGGYGKVSGFVGNRYVMVTWDRDARANCCAQCELMVLR
jgi:hypothetical protein